MARLVDVFRINLILSEISKNLTSLRSYFGAIVNTLLLNLLIQATNDLVSVDSRRALVLEAPLFRLMRSF